MKLTLIAFSRAGAGLCRILCEKLNGRPDSCCGYVPEKYVEARDAASGIIGLRESASEWAGRMFAEADGLIFIGACGIAVRSIAPWIQDKYTDPAVVVIDDAGRHVISLLSGHLGGANDLTRQIAEILGAEPIITTASDVQGICAADEWAAGLGMAISDRSSAKKVAAAVLDGQPVGFWEDSLCLGYCKWQASKMGRKKRPDGCVDDSQCENQICVSPCTNIAIRGEVLHLIPRCLMIGVGCKKGTERTAIESVIRYVLDSRNLDERALACIASIDRKSKEKGLIDAAKTFGVPFVTFSAEALGQIPGDFSESDFVRRTVGIGNVCERAAYAAGLLENCDAGICRELPEGWEVRLARLLTRRYADRGVTVAVAVPVYQEQEHDT